MLDMETSGKVSDADVWEDSALIELYVNASYNLSIMNLVSLC